MIHRRSLLMSHNLIKIVPFFVLLFHLGPSYPSEVTYLLNHIFSDRPYHFLEGPDMYLAPMGTPDIARYRYNFYYHKYLTTLIIQNWLFSILSSFQFYGSIFSSLHLSFSSRSQIRFHNLLYYQMHPLGLLNRL